MLIRARSFPRFCPSLSLPLLRALARSVAPSLLNLSKTKLFIFRYAIVTMCAHLGCHVCWFERIYSSSTRQRYTLAFQKIKVCWIWYMSVHSFYFQTYLALLFLFVFVCVKQFRVACCAAIDVYCLFCFVFLSFPTMVDFTFLQLPHNRTSITVLNRIHFRTTAIRFPTWLDASLLNGNGVNSEELLDLRPAQHSTFQTWIERQCFFLFILRLFFMWMFCICHFYSHVSIFHWICERV